MSACRAARGARCGGGVALRRAACARVASPYRPVADEARAELQVRVVRVREAPDVHRARVLARAEQQRLAALRAAERGAGRAADAAQAQLRIQAI